MVTPLANKVHPIIYTKNVIEERVTTRGQGVSGRTSKSYSFLTCTLQYGASNVIFCCAILTPVFHMISQVDWLLFYGEHVTQHLVGMCYTTHSTVHTIYVVK